MLLRSVPCLFLLLFIYTSGLAQDRDLVYYKNLSIITKDTVAKLIAIDSVLSKSYKTDLDTFIKYSLEYIDLAKAIDSTEWAAKKAMNLQNPLTNYRNDPMKAVSVISNVISHKYKIKDSFLLGGLYLKRGGANFRMDLTDAINDYTLAIENFGINDSIYIADAYLFRGQAYSDMGQFIDASKDYNLSYTYFEKLKDYQYMLHAHQGNITMYSMNGFYEKAKKERDILIDKLIELDLNEFLTNEYFNQSLDYRKMGKDNLQIQSLLRAQENYKDSVNSKDTFIAIHSGLVEYYSSHDEPELTEAHLDSIERVFNTVKDDQLAALHYNGAKAIYFENNGSFDKALVFAQKKLENAKALKHEDGIMNSYLLIADIYAEIGDEKKSYENKSAYLSLKESAYNRTSANALAHYQTLLETEKKEKELVEKNTNIQLLEKDNETFKKMVGFSSIAVLLGFVLVILYRNQSHLKAHKKLQERFSQELLASQEEERKRISKDLHDGLGQQLLLIKNKIISTGDDSTKKMVDTAIDEVRAISRDLHPFQLQEMGITKAIEFTLNQIDENTTLFISSEIDNIDNVFSKEEEINIYRIVQESLSNVIKHAKAEASKVSVKKFTDTIIISVKDNGIGFDFAEEYRDVKSLGLKTLLERTKFLNGQMKVHSKKDSGTILEFQFPLA